jgi:hypothetical protein
MSQKPTFGNFNRDFKIANFVNIYWREGILTVFFRPQKSNQKNY